jgi:hypothetical protein
MHKMELWYLKNNHNGKYFNREGGAFSPYIEHIGFFDKQKTAQMTIDRFQKMFDKGQLTETDYSSGGPKECVEILQTHVMLESTNQTTNIPKHRGFVSVIDKIDRHLAGKQLNESRDIKDLENFLIRYKKGTKTKEMAGWIVQDFFRKADSDDVKEMMGWLEEEHPEIAKELKSRNLEQLNEDNNGCDEIIIKAIDKNHNLKKIIQEIQDRGNVGHSFNIIIDPDDNPAKIGWDGDGSDKIKSIMINGSMA